MKKITLLILVFLSLFLAMPIKASSPVNVYVFESETCPHCRELKAELQDYAKTRPWLTPHYLEVSKNADNRRLMQQVAEKLKISASSMPLTVIGNQHFVGYSSAIDGQIKQQIENCREQVCDDIVNQSTGKIENQAPSTVQASNQNGVIDLPLVGRIDTKSVPIPVLTIIIGLIDGFNPCAMWALVFIITLLIGVKDRRRMWAYGLAFIITSAVVYFLFLLAWLKVFDFIGFARPIQIVIGMLAAGIGVYYLREWRKKEDACKVTNLKSRQQFFQKMKQSIQTQHFWLGLAGIVLLALVINLVELVCSAGLPAIYTAVLSGLNLSTWQYIGYLLLYCLFFVLDDIIVLGLAMKTMKIINADSKYSKLSRLIGGIIMLVLGVLLLLAPQWLSF